jgi:outer membrane protein TolC
MYKSDYSKNLITAEEKVAELMKQRDAALIRAEKAEAELISLRAEVRQARKAWLGGDYDHLPLIEAMEKFRMDRDDELDVTEKDHDQLRAELDAERERVRVLREALERRHDEQSYHCQYVDDALAATEESK